jgi:hypothetical protein
MKISTLTIEMAANVARLRQDMDRAQKTVDKAMGGISKAAKLAGGALAALGIGLSVSAFSGWIKGAINAADAAAKLARSAGVASKDVAGLQLAFRQSGLTDQDLSTKIGRLNKQIADGGKAFEAMGISTRNVDGSLKGARQMLGEVADKFKAYEDGAAKAALAQELFGKGGEKMISLLNGGSESLAAFDDMAQRLGLTLNDKTQVAAEQFNDTLDLIGQAGQGVARQVAAQLLPTLNTLAGEMFRSVTEGDRLTKVSTALAGAMKGLYSVAVGVVTAFQTVGKALGGVGAAIAAILRGDFGQVKGIISEMRQDISENWQRAGAGIQRVWEGAGDASVSALAATMRASKEAAPVVAGVGRSARTVRDEFSKLADQLAGKIVDGWAAAEAGAQGYNRAQKDFLRLTASPQWAAFTNEQRAQITILSEKLILQEQEAAAVKAVAVAQEEARKAYAESLGVLKSAAESAEKRVQEMEREAQALVLAESLQVGLAEAVELTVIARLKEQQILSMGNDDAVMAIQREIDAREKLIGMMRDRRLTDAAAQSARETAAHWEKTWDQVAQSMTDALVNGGVKVKDLLKNMFKTLVLRPIIDPIMRGLSSMFTGMFGGGGGSVGSIGAGLFGGAGSALGAGMQAGLGGLLSGAGMSTFATGISAAFSGGSLASFAGGIGTALGAALPVVAVIGGIASVFKKRVKEQGFGVRLNAGVAGDAFDYTRRSSVLGGSSTRMSASSDPMAMAFAVQAQAVAHAGQAMAGALGLGQQAIEAYTGELRVNMKGVKDAADAQGRINKALDDMQFAMLRGADGFDMTREKFGQFMSGVRAEIEKAGAGTDKIADIIVAGMMGRMDQSQVGQALADSVLGGIYQTIASPFAGQIAQAFQAQIITPVFTAILAGVPISQAISQQAIDSVVATAQQAASALNAIFSDPGFRQAIGGIQQAISGIAAASVRPSRNVRGLSSSLSTAARAADTARDAWSRLADSIIDEIRRIRGDVLGSSDSGIENLQALFAMTTAQARAGSQDAAERLPALSRDLIEASRETASSLADFRAIQTSTLASLEATASLLASQYGIKLPSFDVGTNYVPRDMVARVHRGEAIIPAKYNPAAGGSDELAREVRDLKAASMATATAINRLESGMSKLTSGYNVMRNQEVAS